MDCSCGSLKTFEACCQLYLEGVKLPPSAEQLMRSRYTAFTREDYAYIKNTIAPESRKGLDIEQLKQAVAKTQWKGLEILATDKGGIADVVGTVEFNAKY